MASLKLKPSFETEIYVSDTGYLCIKQVDSLGEQETILLSPDQAQKLSRSMMDFLVDQETFWIDTDEGDDK
jgi:hypothetical protein